MASAQGIYFYDQQSAPNPSFAAGASGIQTSSPVGQSFTPTLASIDFVNFAFFDAVLGNDVGATVYVNLHSTGMGGPILAATTPVFMPDNFGWNTSNNGENIFMFPTTVALQPGTTYYFEVVVQAGDLWAIRGTELPYNGGTAFLNGLPATGDFYFREGIMVPEPTAYSLVILGMGVFWLLRRHKNPSKC